MTMELLRFTKAVRLIQSQQIGSHGRLARRGCWGRWEFLEFLSKSQFLDYETEPAAI